MSSNVLRVRGRLVGVLAAVLVGCNSPVPEAADAGPDTSGFECGYLDPGWSWFTECPEGEFCVTTEASDYDLGYCDCGLGRTRGEAGDCETYFVVGEQVVSDPVSGLEWTRHRQIGTYLAADGYCEGLVLGGHDDWRLPERAHLNTIVPLQPQEFDRMSFPAITEPLWTSEWFGENVRWCVSTVSRDGGVCIGGQIAIAQHLCVRAGVSP